MRKEEKKIAVLTTKEILMYLIDFSVLLFTIFDKGRIYRKAIRDYWEWREFDHNRFSKDLYRLKRAKLIHIYHKGKERYVELTPRGFEKLRKYSVEEIKISTPKVWDKKWRIVIFDIPNEIRKARDILRERLKRLGFIQLQESVFIYPFKCKKIIDYIAEIYQIKPFLKYVIADIIEGDEELIEEFLDRKILEPKMIKK